MSNNSQDEPDEYEIIFDGSNPASSSQSKIEISDAEPVGSTDYIDAEVGSVDDDPDSFMKNHQSDAEEGDIEDGIFAPVRKSKGVGKKTASLMWAVSLLAFVGVGAFVYVTNPDILSKVTNNIGGAGDITLPNDAATADTATNDALTEPVTQPDPSLQATDGTEIKPEAIQDTTAHDSSQDSSAVPSDTPVAAVAPTVDLMTPDNAPAAQPSDTTAASVNAEVNPTAKTEVVASPDASMMAATSAEEPIVATASPAVEAAPVDAHAQSASSPVQAAPSSEVIAPTNEPEQPIETEAAQNQVAPSVAVAPAIDTAPVAAKTASSNITKADATLPAKGTTPVIVASKEEKKAIDDANLDKYFDSPSGKMLKDIPAPSMNPDKGHNESIIVVNKKGQKSNPQYSKPAGKISIETTSLNAQVVSANRAVKLGRYDAAKEMYDDLYKLNPRDPQILSGRAILLQKMGFNDQAIAAYEELLKQDPDNADAIVNLSGLIRKQYPAVALNKLLDLHMTHPNNVDVTAQLGVAYADAGNYSDALRYLSDAAAMDPKNALHFYNIAVVLEKAKKSDQAVAYYEKALEVDAIYGEGQKTISKEKIYDRLAQIRGN
jgi:tetratricopeptide (TPR) repeat protein